MPGPVNTTPGDAGTKRWCFCWTLDRNRGIELRNVRYATDAALTGWRTVFEQVSVEALFTRYSRGPGGLPTSSLPCNPNCTGPPDATGCAACLSTEPEACAAVLENQARSFNEPPNRSYLRDMWSETHCSPVPETVCNVPDGPAAECLEPIDCADPAACVRCRGVCVSTQKEAGTSPVCGFDEPEEWDNQEFASGSPTADVVLTATFLPTDYQWVQRYRFKDDGRLYATMRLAGLHLEEWHHHVIYWRVQLPDPASGASQLAERCSGSAAACAPASDAWEATDCECDVAAPATRWRLFETTDGLLGDRWINVIRGANDQADRTFCEAHDKAFCALRAPDDIVSTFDADDCTDGLDTPEAVDTCEALEAEAPGAPLAFYYVVQYEHNPCVELRNCNPALGERSLGAEFRLLGDW